MSPSLLHNRYELKEPLGQGGMATVYRAVDHNENKDVAIKLFSKTTSFNPPTHTPPLKHEHIVQIHHHSGSGESPAFMVMEYIPGIDLRRLSDALGPLPPLTVAALLHPVTDALAHCHARGVRHGDLKPANLMVVPHTGRVVLMDFGPTHPAPAKDAPLIGTPEFLSPEQLLEHPLDPALDIFALGSLTYTLLTGRSPFEAPDQVETLRRIIDVEYTPATSLIPDLPQFASDLLQRCLLATPADRASAEELHQQLNGILGGEGVAVPATHLQHWLGTLPKGLISPKTPK